MLSLCVAVAVIMLFWFLVTVSTLFTKRGLNCFSVKPSEEKKVTGFFNNADKERKQICADLEKGVLIQRLYPEHGADREVKFQTLLNEGIAENRTINDEDKKHVLAGDSWLCNHRPYWFAVLQLMLVAPATAIFARWISDDILALFSAAGVSFLLWTVILAWLSGLSVPENHRLGIKRFGIQLQGYLSPGLQFVLPFWIERWEEITLQNGVWGPHKEGPLGNEFRINGTSGDGNPAPGKFQVMLRGYWPLAIEMTITLRVCHSRKSAWWSYLNSYRHIDEIGEQIASVATAIVMKRAREVKSDEQGNGGEDYKNPKHAIKMFTAFLNELPEISGAILLSLMRLGSERLGGLLPISVAITTVTSGEAFQGMMQKADQAEVDRFVQTMAGQAAKLRLSEIQKALASVTDPKDKTVLIDVLRVEAQLVLNQRVGEKGPGASDVLAAALTTRFQEGGSLTQLQE